MNARIGLAMLRGAVLGLAILHLGCGGQEDPNKKDTVVEPPVPPKDACGAVVPTSSVTFNVKDAAYGALGNGSADDTLAIQRAIDAAAGTGGTVLIPDGTYMIDAVKVTTSGNHGLSLRSNMTLRMSSGAILKALPNNQGNSVVVLVGAVSNVNIVGGTIIGERATHVGTTGEGGMGLTISGSSHIVVQGVTAKECWGDGFYIGDESKDVSVCNLVADHNRRQGLTITSVDGLAVRNSTFKNTAGIAPEAGIDIEPNVGEMVNNVLITGCNSSNNAGNGFATGVPIANTGLSFIRNLVVDANTFNANGLNPEDGYLRNGVLVTNSDGNRITNNTISNTVGRGILLRSNATNTVIQGNQVTGSSQAGIYLSQCSGSPVSGNTVSGNGYGIYQASGAGAVVGTNTLASNGTSNP